jgi:hypothetical protein
MADVLFPKRNWQVGVLAGVVDLIEQEMAPAYNMNHLRV